MRFKERNAEFKNSPYTGSHRCLHLILLDMANGDGVLWPKQQTLAEMVGVSLRQIERGIARFIKDGWLEVVKRTKEHNIYRVIKKAVQRDPDPTQMSGSNPTQMSGSNPTQMSGSNPTQMSGSNPTQMSGSYIEEEPQENLRNTAADAAAEEEPVPTVTGGFGEDDPFETPPRKQPRQRSEMDVVMARWAEAMRRIGIRDWSQGHLRMVLKGLSLDHTWAQVERIMLDFIDAEAKDIQRKAGKVDPVKMFHQAVNRGLAQVRYPTPAVAAARTNIGEGRHNYNQEADQTLLGE